MFSFDYSVGVNGGSITIDGTAVTAGGGFSKKLEAGETVAVVLTSNESNDTATTISISNMKMTEEKNVTVTFKARELRRYISLNVPFCPGVYRPFGDMAVDHFPDEALIPFGVALAEAFNRASRQVDQEFALWGFLLQTMQILKKYAPEWHYGV